ncbi:ABC transporter ATP-binding protein [Natronomonas sp. F2-12]|uniref:ABC transporter ATP-binding protein n=1 Tax=Natronomonas aquatica TaxID=2841590 RepID=A0A9R1CWG8_9EURY|nr:ABC transporter ATP-binding protein [Natronomonas aquatica]MCQ4334726.1 ABC transporter ATP-binding protein [Natronomonas aquatica]
MPGIEIVDVSKKYSTGGGGGVQVLDGLSLSVVEGEFRTIVGPSGCGKTTLLHLIAGLESTDKGYVTLPGDGQLGFVFQEPRLLEWQTVGENLKFALDGTEIPKSNYDSRITEVIETVGLSDFRDEYPRTLSGGMQQRVALARALCIEPDVLLMDEPFASLDEITAKDLRHDLLELWQENSITILFVTHDIREAIVLSDTISILSRKPADIIASVDITSPRPRELTDDVTADYYQRIFSKLNR